VNFSHFTGDMKRGFDQLRR